MAVKLTSADIRNGWTQETLEQYHKTREEQKVVYALEQEKHKPVKVENTLTYNPHEF